ncbi:putative ribonuclease H-like domain-containing protein [Tanacetum coccineum]
MDVKSTFLYGKIEEEVYVCQPPGFEDPDFPDRVYKVEKALYRLHQATRACDVKTVSTPMETQKPLLKDVDGEDIDEHLYRSMIGSLMYLTSSRPDIMFAVNLNWAFGILGIHSFDLVASMNSDYEGNGIGTLKRRLSVPRVQVDFIAMQEADYVKNPVFHSKTKHIEIRHHFIRDSNEKKLIQMIKIHTDQNVTDLLTKAFDVSIFQYLIASIGMLNL